VHRVFGSRTFFETAFLIAVPMTALALGLGRWRIVGVSAVGYLIVLLVEAAIWRAHPRTGGANPRQRVTPEPVPEPEPVLAPIPEAPSPAPPGPAATPPAPEPAAAAVVREPEAKPAAEPEPVRVLQPVPDREPGAEPPPIVVEPVVVEVGAVVPIGVSAQPRQWNLWDLERLTRERSTGDAIRDEERSFLLMYLREFAGPDGELPVDFDGLVRDSFGELVGAR
jgi:hypothetical protein